MGDTVGNRERHYSLPHPHHDSEITGQGTRGAAESGEADNPQQKTLCPEPSQQAGEGKRGREHISFHGCALAEAKRGRFDLSQAPASATLFTSCLFIVAVSKSGMGRCDLYDYKPPKGTKDWQSLEKDGAVLPRSKCLPFGSRPYSLLKARGH